MIIRESRNEVDVLLDHGLNGGRLLLLHLLREPRESGEDEQRGDCEISDGLVQRLQFVLHFVCEHASKGHTKNSENRN